MKLKSSEQKSAQHKTEDCFSAESITSVKMYIVLNLASVDIALTASTTNKNSSRSENIGHMLKYDKIWKQDN